MKIELPGNTWNLTLSPREGWYPTYLETRVILPIVIVGALVLSTLILMVYQSKKVHYRLLRSMLPKRAIKKLSSSKQVVEYFDEVTIYFSDLVGYTSMSSSMHPVELFELLNSLYSGFDQLVIKHGVSKVETIGDAYFVIGGAPDRKIVGAEAARRVAAFALDALDLVEEFMAERQRKGQEGCLKMRAGMASGLGTDDRRAWASQLSGVICVCICMYIYILTWIGEPGLPSLVW